MEPNQKKKLFICKFCNKRYPCGKSLGGHIRIHLNGNGNSTRNVNVNGIGNSTDLEEDESFIAANGSNSKRDSELYRLRENPKKTKRFVVDPNNRRFLQEKICKECGKGFHSLKALCGHMASHSKSSFEDQSETTERLKDQVFDSQSDTETSAPSKRRRSKRMKYKTIGVYSSSLSSAASDLEQEQEEVALCLMMLSKDSGFKGCFSSIGDSSDNNSVVLETKSSSSPKLKISVKKNGVNCVYNKSNGVLGMNRAEKQESVENDQSENSDSGYFRNGPKRVESEVSVHGFFGNDESKKPKAEFGSGFEVENSFPELEKRLSRFRRIKRDLGKDLAGEEVSRKRSQNEFNSHEFPRSNSSKMGKCPVVENRTSHKKANAKGDRSDSVYESGENSINTDSVPSSLPNTSKKVKSCKMKNPIVQKLSGNPDKKLGIKKGKVHECPFCFKVFRSGQALGGHKRSHFVGGGEDRTVVINQQVPEISMPALLDLNLPAPVEEDANGYYIPTW